jgi:hypothetical protein
VLDGHAIALIWFVPEGMVSATQVVTLVLDSDRMAPVPLLFRPTA